MKIITGPRQSGRTTELLMWLLEGHIAGKRYVLIVTNEAEVKRLTKILYEIWESSGKHEYVNAAANSIVSAFRFRDTDIGKYDALAIDDMDNVIELLLHSHVSVAVGSVVIP